jgi:hypothetical protein
MGETPDDAADSSRTFHRFDSLTELIEFCKRVYETDEVAATTEDGTLVVRIARPGGEPFTRMVVYFEGERTYVIGLPEGVADEER